MVKFYDCNTTERYAQRASHRTRRSKVDGAESRISGSSRTILVAMSFMSSGSIMNFDNVHPCCIDLKDFNGRVGLYDLNGFNANITHEEIAQYHSFFL